MGEGCKVQAHGGFWERRKKRRALVECVKRKKGVAQNEMVEGKGEITQSKVNLSSSLKD